MIKKRQSVLWNRNPERSSTRTSLQFFTGYSEGCIKRLTPFWKEKNDEDFTCRG
jgi:hypothetical protein